MASQKVTVTLPEGQVDEIRRLITEGKAASVSGFVQHAVGIALDDIVGWGTMLAEALDETGGPPTANERQWAEAAIRPVKRRRRPPAA